ncbi:FAD-binding oxidoreductase [Pontiellaceae bacterium B12227]|nr:FAD-binding oxidoreductase [Pontiellaceae bacterium B12227]
MGIEIKDVSDEHADYLHDESRREGHAEKICFPTSGKDVVDALEIARTHRWPVTVQGGRTGITGGCVPDGGLIINLSRMDSIGCVEGDCLHVQPGALLADIRAAISGSGLFFPSDLTETTASIGGMVANNASGARSFKYGAVRNWIQSLEVVLPNGELIRVERGLQPAAGLDFRLGSIAGKLPNLGTPEGIKSAAGYFVQPDMDLVDLFIGAEGTLGVVTEITLKLLPEPRQMNGLTAFFESEKQTLDFVRFLRADFDPVSIEYFDFQSLELLRRMKKDNPAFSALPTLDAEYHTALYFEFDSEVPDAVIEKCDSAIDCWFSEGEREIAALKSFRHAIPESVNMLIGERKKTIPALTKLGTDMSVSDERMEAVMQLYHSGLAEAGLDYVIFGHIGNNHVHVNIIPKSMEEFEQGKALYFKWARQVVEWGGSVSAEHGIGKNKTDFLRLMYGPDGIAGMQKLKALFDPDNLVNAGNLFSRQGA